MFVKIDKFYLKIGIGLGAVDGDLLPVCIPLPVLVRIDHHIRVLPRQPTEECWNTHSVEAKLPPKTGNKKFLKFEHFIIKILSIFF